MTPSEEGEFEKAYLSAYKTSDEPIDDMIRELFELMRRARQTDMVPAAEGLTQAESRTLSAIEALHRRCDYVRPGLVAEITHTKTSALSQTLRALEEKGLLERHRMSGDYRGVSLTLTEAGSRSAAQTKRLYTEHMKEVVAFMGEDDIRHLIRILRKIVEFHEAGHDAHTADSMREKETQEGGDSPCV